MTLSGNLSAAMEKIQVYFLPGRSPANQQMSLSTCVSPVCGARSSAQRVTPEHAVYLGT